MENKEQPPYWLTLAWKKIGQILSWVMGLIIAIINIGDYDWEKEPAYCGLSRGAWGVLVLLLIAGVCQAIQCYCDSKRSVDADELERKYHEIQLKNKTISEAIPSIIKNFVIATYERLKLDKEARMSLYLFENDQFLPCARHSRDPNKAKIKRTRYPALRGVIGKVWSNGWWFDNAFPNSSDKKAYKKYCKEEYGLSANEVNALSFKAILYCGIRISDSLGRKPIALLIIESENKESIGEGRIHEELKREVDNLTPLLENPEFRACIPTQAIVDKEEGF